MGASKPMVLVPLFDLKSLNRFCRKRGRDFRSAALDTAGQSPGPVWTAIIPDAFPGYVYRWQIRDDGRYFEEGRDAATGMPIERTLSGHWHREGLHLVLRQDDEPFVFDGVVVGRLYTGTLYFKGRSISGFCAARGEQAPRHCSPAPRVASLSHGL